MAYSNIRARLGTGSNNLEQGGEYPLVRLSNDYMLLLALYRGSWIIRRVVDTLAEDMLKFMPRIKSQVAPDALEKLYRVVRGTATQAKLLEALKWGRLFGGAVAVICIDGVKDLAEPLDPEEILPGKYRGLIVLDRWSGVYPQAELIEDINNPAEFGLPAYYSCDLGSNGKSVKVHHSRLLRFVGRDLPNWEKQVQLYWGMSEIELVFDELRKRDYANWNAVSLVARAQILAVKEPNLAQALSGLGMSQKALETYVARIQAISDSMSNQGLLALPIEGGIEQTTYSFSGLDQILSLNMLDIAGACEIPVSRLYGRTITGLGQSGEGDLQIYYDSADQKRIREVQPQLEKLYRVIAMSTWGEVPEDMDYEWPPIRTISEKERSDLGKSNTDTILEAFNAGVIGRQTALKELRQQSTITGIFSNITDEMIEEADDEVAPDEATDPEGLMGRGEVPEVPKAKKPAAKDSAIARPADFAGIPVAIEYAKGTRRVIQNPAGEVVYDRLMQFDYGFIRDTNGRDGDDIDVILGPDHGAPRVYIADMIDLGADIHQRQDEDKVFLGFRSEREAREAFLSMYPRNFLGGMAQMSLADFKRNWLQMEVAHAA